MASLMQAQANDAYAGVEQWINKSVWDFIRGHGGSFDVLKDIAMEAYCRGVARYDPAMSKLTTWIRWCVWNALLDSRRPKRRPVELLTEPEHVPQPEGWSLAVFLRELSDDAREAVELLVEEIPTHRKSARQMRALLWSGLAEMGWASERIFNCFTEIAEAL